MIPYEKIVYIKNEIYDEHKKLKNLEKQRIKEFNNSILNDDEIKKFKQDYTKLFNKIINKDNKTILNKIVKEVKKINFNSDKNSTFLKKNYTNLYNNLKQKKINVLDFFKTIRKIKLKYDKMLQLNKELLTKKKQENFTKFIEKYHDFNNKNPRLMEGMLNNTLDEKTLNCMLHTYKLYYEKSLSEHDASVKFGTHLVDNFVKPMLNNKK